MAFSKLKMFATIILVALLMHLGNGMEHLYDKNFEAEFGRSVYDQIEVTRERREILEVENLMSMSMSLDMTVVIAKHRVGRLPASE
mmetsp:Transcript_20401/g.47938  ORF Transcript_20401/g.47938 Transcript_20401/m.47938 type:complete len:86 (-) Transcript_20401:201-458(-)